MSSLSLKRPATLCLLLVLLASIQPFDAISQISNEDRARNELESRGLDENELRERLLDKGIDLDNLSTLSSDEAIIAQKTIEETVLEMENEKRSQAALKPKPQKKKSQPQIKDTLKQDSLLNLTFDSDSIKSDLPDVEIYGQHIFKNQSLKVYNRDQNIRPPKTYVLGPGDELVVSVWGLSRLDENLVVNESGFVTPFKMPRVFVSGLTYNQVKEILKGRYAQYYQFRSNEFEVGINYTRLIEVNIFGEVKNYGGFTLSATNTAFNALVAAGGPNDIGSVRRIKLRRDGEVKEIDVYAFMNDPSLAADYYLQDNDIIQVPVADNIVTILGQVNRPFKYELLEGEDLEDAINFAGGFTTAALMSRIEVVRYEGAEKIILELDFRKDNEDGKAFGLKHGDVIKVAEVDVKVNNYVVASGEVSYPGNYARQPGMKLSQLVEKAGLKPTSRRDLAFLKRDNGDGTVNLQRIDLTQVQENGSDDIALEDKDELIVYSKSRYIDSTFFEVNGAVREPGSFLIDQTGTVTLYDAIVLSGGLKKDAQDYAYVYRPDPEGRSDIQYVRVDLKAAIGNIKSDKNISLYPGDQLVIGSKNTSLDEQYIDVVGAVRQPGRYSYGKGMTILDVLSLSGGFTFSAASNRIDLFRVEMKDNRATKTIIATLEVDRDLSKVGQKDNIVLQPFDQIVVREVPEFEFQQNVRVQGEVRYPGPYALTMDNERLHSVVERSGNLTLEAFPEGATLFREMDSIGYVVIDLNQALKDPKSNFNVILKDGDIIDIPKQQDLVRIIGFTNAAELYPDRILTDQNGIAVPYHAKKNARFYIDKFAAGVSPDGDRSKITVEHANGQIEKTQNFGLFKSYPKVRPGSIIRVGERQQEKEKTASGEEKEDVDWGKVFANSVAQATTILSLILLLQRID